MVTKRENVANTARIARNWILVLAEELVKIEDEESCNLAKELQSAGSMIEMWTKKIKTGHG